MEDPGRPTEVLLDVFIHFTRGVGSETAGARPADLFQQQQECPERVSSVSMLFAS